MARKKAATNTAPTDAPVDTQPAQNGAVDPFEPVKVNNASIAELKIACDDAVRRVRIGGMVTPLASGTLILHIICSTSRDRSSSGREIHISTSGWHSGGRLSWWQVSRATMAGRETLKKPSLLSLSGCCCKYSCIDSSNILPQAPSPRYFLLTAIQTAYAYFVEGKIIYVGRRRTLSNRVCILHAYSLSGARLTRRNLV